ncbi:MAG: SDR family oxidoreductase, partial [Vicinamibacterales bacterium]
MPARPILVIGATGTVGRHVVRGLGAQGWQVRAMTRNREGAHFPADTEIVPGDLTVPDTLDACLDGVDSVFLVGTAPPAATDSALARIAKR